MSTKTPAAPAETPARLGPIAFLSSDAPFIVPPGVHQIEEFRRWATHPDFPDNVRVFFNQGALWFDMSKEELETHNKVKGEIYRALATLVNETDVGELYSDGVLVTNVAAEVSNNPDAVFVRWESFDEETVTLIARQDAPGQFIEIEGAPDLVLEVVSHSSVKKDTVELREAYHRAGIPEYWLVAGCSEEINFQILQHRKTRYYATRRKEGWLWSNIFGRWFRLERSRGRRNLWRYRLENRAE